MPKSPIDYEKLKELILTCPDKECQAAMAIQYVLACRLGELFPKDFDKYHSDGLLVDSFQNYPSYWQVSVANFKQRKKKLVMKNGFILKEGENWLSDICLNWRKEAIDKGRRELFTVSPEGMRKRIKKSLAGAGYDVKAQKTVSSHNLRDSRADHLLKLFGFNILDVQKTLGHANLKTTSEYIDSSVDERVKKLKEATKK